MIDLAAEPIAAQWQGAVRYFRPTTYVELFERQARRAPDEPALCCGQIMLSYAELDARANKLARLLAARGVGAEQVVAVALPRTAELVVALLAVLKAGAAYLPVDLDYPSQRIMFMLDDAEPACVLTDRRTGQGLSDAGATGWLLVDDADIKAELACYPSSPLTSDDRVAGLTAANAAYVIYTSGSTGTPKAVVVEHRALSGYVDCARRSYPSLAGTSLWHSPASFDMTVTSLWAPLVAGGMVRVTTLTDEGESPSCTFLKMTPSHLPLLEALPAGFSPTGELMLGGEALVGESLEDWRGRHPAVTVLNVYGPTEATVNCAEHVIRPGAPAPAGIVPLGSPMDNTRLYVLDAALRLVPDGMVGEIYICSAGLARGYLRRAGLTAARFVADPLRGGGERMYRTGDLGRWSPAGVLEFAGRVDDQVKMRGFRIEAGEIEAVLGAHPAVASAAAVVREDRPGDQRIVAYVVPRGARRIDTVSLRSHAAAQLPEHMVPSAFVILAALPLTANGKLDRPALPAPGPRLPQDQRSPRTEREKLLCALFAEVLGVPEVGLDNGFFELGGHSLLAVRLVSKIRSAMAAELSVRAVFESPTVAGLASRIDEAPPARPALAPAVRPARMPLSDGQQRLWFLHRLEQPSAMYNMSRAIRLTGHLDRAALRAAIADVVIRHESLRTMVTEVDGAAYQLITDPAQVSPAVTFVDTSQASLGDLLRDSVRHTFDLHAEPPLRVTVASVGPAEHVLLLLTHHIAADGWSVGPLARDLSRAYAARCAGLAPSWPAQPLQYADYALWHRESLGEDRDPGSVIARQLTFWREALAGPLPGVTALPTDRPRPAIASHAGGVVSFSLSAQLHHGLVALAQQTASTVFMVTHAAIAALLTRLGAGTDLPIGTAVAGRGDELLDDVVGFFVNTLVLRTDTAGNPTFRELLERVRRTDVAAFAHQDVPFDRLVEEINPTRTLSHHPLYQVMLTFQEDVAGQFALPGLRAELLGPESVSAGAAKFDLSFDLRERRSGAGAPAGIEASLEYAADLFDPATAAAIASRLVRLLESALADPDRPIHDVDILAPTERHDVIVAWNDTSRPVPPATLPELFTAAAVRCADAVAVVCGEDSLTYAELDERSNRLARLLVRRGAGPERFVAVLLPKSVDLVVALLAVLKAGSAYLPVEPTDPPARIEMMLDDVRPVLVVTSAASSGLIPAAWPAVVLDDKDALAVLADQDGQHLTDDDRTDPLAPANPAFVIFTSGSTGRPKAVVVEHRSLNVYLAWSRQAYGSVAGRSLVHSPISFDLTVTGLFATLTAGGCVDLVDLDRGAAPGHGHPRPTFAKATPSYLPLLTELPEAFSPSEQLVLGGEALTGEVLSTWRSRHPAATVINEYGPTETTVGCMEYRIEPGDELTPGVITIGRPIWNTRTYILDAALRPAPVGVVGELYIAGELIARGYHDRPGLTAGRFVADPCDGTGARMYRSGDLARWRGDGLMEFTGRVDNQVKLRGYRIELGEVEAVLRQHPAVQRVAAAVREDQPGDRRLVCYVVPGQDGIDGEALLRHAAGLLPDYMVPAAVVTLPALPLTVNRKLDRAALPAPACAVAPGRAVATGAAARSPLAQIMCGLFAEVLALPSVGVDDNFFDLGGHSLLAARLISRVRATFAAELQLRALFESPSPAGLLGRLAAAGDARIPVQSADRPGRLPLSYVQHRLWFLHRLEGPSASYNVPFAVRLTGRLDLAALEAAIGDVVDRHESLRTTFPEVDGDPCQRILSPGQARPTLTVRPAAAGELSAALDDASRHRFDLTVEPPLKAVVFRVDQRVHVLLLVVHHIAMDGGSQAPLARDLSDAYTARLRGTDPQWGALPLQYADYALWQRRMLGAEDDTGSEISRQLAYWVKALAGLPELLRLPTDRPRPGTPSLRGSVVELSIGADLLRGLTDQARQAGATVFMVVQAALATLLTRLGAGADVPIGAPVSGRADAAVDAIVGPFINTVVLRTDTSGDPSFRQLLSRVRDVDLTAYAHQDVPFDRVVEAVNPARSLAHHPVFQVMLALQDDGECTLQLPGITTEQVSADTGVAKFDLSFSLRERTADCGGAASMVCEVEYAEDLFDRATVELLAHRLARLLAATVADPDLPLSQLEIMSPGERTQLLDAGHGASHPVPVAAVAELFATQVAKAPGALALTGALRLSYAELNERANRLAHRLIRAGVGPETPVAVLVGQSAELVVASLAVAKAGGCYVPLHASYPPARLRMIVQESRARVLLTDRGAQHRELAGDVGIVAVDDPGLAAELATDPPVSVAPDQLAYVIYTSGSTGRPKGVAVTHRDVVALASDRRWRGGAQQRVLMHSAYAFDASTYEMWVPLLNGGCVVVAPAGDLGVRVLAGLIDEHEITSVFLTTALFNLVAEEHPTCFASLREVWTGGEMVSPRAFKQVLDSCPGTRLIHVYGPTETTTFATCVPIPRPCLVNGTVPIGQPMDNTRAYVLDSGLRLVPVGVPGELYLAGLGVARGYLNQPAATAVRFVADPLTGGGGRLYRTGDLARWNARHQLEYLGRTDDQVKLRGFRIEPGEIEGALASHPQVAQVTVLAREDGTGGKRLVAYTVPTSGGQADPASLRSHLAPLLPSYMIPAAYVSLSELPLTVNGKLDRGALPAPEIGVTAAGRSPRSPSEEILCRLFANVLELPAVSIDDVFFEIGGHSLMATRLVSRIRSACGVELTVRDVFEYPTVAVLAKRLDSAAPARLALRSTRVPTREELQ